MAPPLIKLGRRGFGSCDTRSCLAFLSFDSILDNHKETLLQFLPHLDWLVILTTHCNVNSAGLSLFRLKDNNLFLFLICFKKNESFLSITFFQTTTLKGIFGNFKFFYISCQVKLDHYFLRKVLKILLNLARIISFIPELLILLETSLYLIN